MPCYVSEGERQYYANLEARNILERLNISYCDILPNEKLCQICSSLSLNELKEKELEEWYIKHLKKDSEHDPMRFVNEILRLYGEQ